MQHLFNAEKGSFEKQDSYLQGEREVALRVHPDLLNSEIDSISIDFSLDMTWRYLWHWLWITPYT